MVRLLLSLITFLEFTIKTADIKGEYLQSGPVMRDLYIRPANEWMKSMSYRKGILWTLTKLPYGISAAGRQCTLAIE